jgi:Xaa-Pro aminopeptidase
MKTMSLSVPAAFTNEDFAARMRRVLSSAVESGLAGIIVTPGPDLVWLTGYHPTAATERLTMLVLSPDNEPTLLVPILERPDAEAAEGTGSVSLVDWQDGTDPYEVASPLLRSDGEFGISDSAWALHLLGLQRALPRSRYRSLTESLPMMRAVKDSNELMRLAAAGEAADSAYNEIIQRRFAGRRETDVAADLADLLREFGHEQIDFTVVGSGPNGANPHHEAGDRVIEPGDAVVLDFGGLRFGYASDTTRTVCVGEPTSQIREVHEVVRRAQRAVSMRCGRVSAARRSTGQPGRSSAMQGTASSSFIALATASGSPLTSRRTWSRARSNRSCLACAFPSNRGSTSQGGLAYGSRTLSPSRHTGASASTTLIMGCGSSTSSLACERLATPGQPTVASLTSG